MNLTDSVTEETTEGSGPDLFGPMPTEDYDYKGALLFVVGLMSLYGVAIFLLIISLIRKSRSELELKDHQRDFEAMKRASQKRSLRAKRTQQSVDDWDEGPQARNYRPFYSNLRKAPLMSPVIAALKGTPDEIASNV